ncbi:hypothetical protein DE146DRAFT_751179 [Phaeosphaeria sp. MPI-PUGE-AT-0046c]|nr:hypothetical protein DE146DRAFT_751179 [Phaeosphaeria sp. MPI-PUGE-AT-0046c]
MAQPHINAFYRIWFTWLDPVTLLLTMVSSVLNPAGFLEMLADPKVAPYVAVQHGPLIWQCAPLYGFMGLVFAFLLRASPDPKVWRIVQAATLMVDVGLVVIMVVALDMQGRLAVGEWRPIERVNIVFTVLVGIGRIAFLLGVGETKGKVAEKRA